MSLAAGALAFFCFVYVVHSAPLTCNELLQPLDQVDLNHLEGSWALVAGSLLNPDDLERFKTRDSARISFSNTSDASTILISRMFGFGDRCEYSSSNITLEGSGFSYNNLNITVTFIHTSCSDCLLLQFNKSGTLRNMYLFSRRREVEKTEMEEFKAQADCVKSLPPVKMDHNKELCPEQAASHQTGEQTEGQNS